MGIFLPVKILLDPLTTGFLNDASFLRILNGRFINESDTGEWKKTHTGIP